MKEMKVHLLVGNLPLYTELFEHPPKGIKYLGKPTKGVKEYYSKINWLKRKFLLYFNKVCKLPRMMYVFTNADLIHSNRGICILNRKPWVIDMDHASAFVGFNHETWKNLRYRGVVKRFLLSKYCKKIMAWSTAAKHSLLNSFPKNERLKEKIEVLYPATLYYKIRKSKNEVLTLLFVGSLFKEKGGQEVLESFKILRKRYDLRLLIKADVPTNLKRKYNFKEIEYFSYKHEILSRIELLKKFFAKADIFVYPTYFDIFGLCLLDALATGLPIVATNVFAVPEIVEDGKGGFLINSPIKWHDETYLWNPTPFSIKRRKIVVNQLVNKLSMLIENSFLRKKMSRYNKKLVVKGKFSIKERNKKLKKIYEESVKI